MARVLFTGLIEEINGSIGGLTFQRNRSGSIIRIKSGTNKNSTAKQTNSHRKHSIYATQWRNLGFDTKIQWSDFADLHTKQNKWGQVKNVSGFNWFESINYYLDLIGGSGVSSPPEYLLPEPTPSFSVLLTPSTITLTLPSPVILADTSIVIFTTAPTPFSSNNWRPFLRLTKVLTGNSYSSIDITSDWETAHNQSYPPAGSDFRFQIGALAFTVHDITGITNTAIKAISGVTFTTGGIGSMMIGNTFVIGGADGIGEWEIENTFIVQP